MSGNDTVVGTRADGAVPPAPDRPPAAGRSAGRLLLGGLLVLLGVLWLLAAAGLALPWRLLLPAALTLVGLALLATARRGVHGGLIAAGIVLSVLVFASSVAPTTIPLPPLAGVGDRIERPTSLAETVTDYELGMGKLTVDLRDVTVPVGGAEVAASVGMGELVVRLPEGVGAQVRATSGAGEVVVLGASRGGVGVSVTEEIPGRSTVVLDLSVGMGKVEVRR